MFHCLAHSGLWSRYSSSLFARRGSWGFRKWLTKSDTASSKWGEENSNSLARPRSSCSWPFFDVASYIIFSCCRGQALGASRPNLALGNSYSYWAITVSGLFYAHSSIPSFHLRTTPQSWRQLLSPLYTWGKLMFKLNNVSQMLREQAPNSRQPGPSIHGLNHHAKKCTCPALDNLDISQFKWRHLTSLGKKMRSDHWSPSTWQQSLGHRGQLSILEGAPLALLPPPLTRCLTRFGHLDLGAFYFAIPA